MYVKVGMCTSVAAQLLGLFAQKMIEAKEEAELALLLLSTCTKTSALPGFDNNKNHCTSALAEREMEMASL